MWAYGESLLEVVMAFTQAAKFGTKMHKQIAVLCSRLG